MQAYPTSLSWKSFVLTCLTSFAMGQNPSQAYDYYDNLRLEEGMTKMVNAPQSDSESNVIRVIDMYDDVYRLLNLAVFMPFYDGTRLEAFNEAAMLLLAIYHFNNKEQSPILKSAGLDDCNIRFTADLYDEKIDPGSSATILTNMLDAKNSLGQPLPAAVVGAYRSAISSPLSILSYVQNIPVISPASTSDAFEDDAVYPLFARTIPSSFAAARAIGEYYANLGVTRIAVLYINDQFGAAFQRSFQAYSGIKGIETEIVAISYTRVDEIPAAVARLSEIPYQNILVVSFNQEYEEIMKAAGDNGMIDGSRSWLFYGLSEASLQDEMVGEPSSPLFNATKGVGVFNFAANLQTNIRLPDDEGNVEALPDLPGNVNEEIRAVRRKETQKPEFLSYMKQKVPGFEGSLGRDPLQPWAYFLYDAVTAIGIAMCRTENEFFNGANAMEQFPTTSFEGATGQVNFTSKNTRKNEQVRLTLWNFVPAEELDSAGNSAFQVSPTSAYSDGQWSEIRPFVYADGGLVQPSDLTPLHVEPTTAGNGLRIFGLVLSGVTLACSFACFVFVILLRKEPAVRSSQPSFLMVVCLGVSTQAISIIPLTLSGADAWSGFCMASPWLYFSGLAISTGAFYAKMSQLLYSFRHPEIDRILVSVSSLAFWVISVVAANGLVLAIWTAKAPLRYGYLNGESTDNYARPLDVYGTCLSDEERNGDFAYNISLFAINAVALLTASIFGIRTRAIEAEYSEIRFIAFALGTCCEAFIIGGPIRQAIADSPDAQLAVGLSVICLTSLVVLLLVFLPKIHDVRRERRKRKEDALTKQYVTTWRGLAGATFDDNNQNGSEEKPKDTELVPLGLKILRHPRAIQNAEGFGS